MSWAEEPEEEEVAGTLCSRCKKPLVYGEDNEWGEGYAYCPRCREIDTP